MLVDRVSESPILELIDEIFRRRQRGEEVLSLHIGEPDFDTPKGIREAAYAAMNEGFTHYVSAQGLPELREAIAGAAAREHGIDCRAEDVVVLPAKFAIYATLLATVGAGDEVLLTDPTYLFEQPVQLVGARPRFVPLTSEGLLDLDGFERAASPKSRLLVLVSPANPTGHVLRRSEVEAALRFARAHDLTVVSDETYESLVYEGEHLAPARVAGEDVPVVTVGSFSKRFAMTGWRAGYAIAPAPIRQRIVRIMEHTLTCLPAFIQKACAWALQNAAPDAERMRREFRARRDHVLERLDRISGLQYPRPEGAFYVFPRYDADVASVALCRDLLSRKGVAVVPGVAFGPAGEHHFRISYTQPRATLDAGLDRLAEYFTEGAGGAAPRADPG